MNIDEIYKLISVFEKSNITGLELEQDNTKIKLSKEIAVSKSFIKESDIETVTPIKGISKNKDYIKAPIAGTIYMSPSPDEEVYVKTGDSVKKGDTLCMVEAMKMFNKIPAPFDCKIKEILVKNEDFAEYDSLLFEIEVL